MSSFDGVLEPPRRRAAVGFIFATALMNAISFGIALPVLPNLIKSFTGGDTAAAAQWGTVFAAAWGALQFLCGPALGVLSDRFGRRPVLLVSLAGLALDFLIIALAPNLGWLLAGRVLNGMTAASLPTANAYIADVTPPEGRARAFGMIGSAFSLGLLCGPVLGGALAGIDLRLPFFVAGGVTALNALYGFAVLPESLAPQQRATRVELRRANPFASLAMLKGRGDLVGLCVLAFVFPCAWMIGPAIFVLYGGYRYGWSAATTGLVLMASGALATFVQMALVGPVVARVGERGAMLIGAGAAALGYLWFGVAGTGAAYLAAMPLFALMNLFMPGLQGQVTRHLSQTEQGQMQGVGQGLQGLASIFGPIVFGLTFAWSIRPGAALHLPGLAYFVASAAMCGAFALALRLA